MLGIVAILAGLLLVVYFAVGMSVRGLAFGGLAIVGILCFLFPIMIALRQHLLVRSTVDQVRTTIKQRFDSMPTESARQLAVNALNNPELCRCVRSTSSDSHILAQLAPELRAFFQEFESVEGPFFTRRIDIAPSEAIPGMIRIADAYGDGHCEYAVRAGEEAVYLVDLEEAPDARTPEFYSPTIWHCILTGVMEVAGREALRAAETPGATRYPAG
jgi:hypothetical protein